MINKNIDYEDIKPELDKIIKLLEEVLKRLPKNTTK